jgi:alkylhydroperoxidase family enzyme
MPHIPYRSEGDIEVEELVAMIRSRRGGDILNLDRMLLHSPPFAKGWNSLLGTTRRELQLAAPIRELVVCAIARMTDTNYEWHQHAPLFLKGGGTQAQLDALSDAPAAIANTSLFNEKERAALQVAMESTRSVRVAPETIARAVKLFGERQTVELVATVAAYNMVARFLQGLGVDEKGE